MGSDLESLASNTISRQKIDPAQVEKEVASLGSRWSIDGEDLKLELRGQPMSKAAQAAAQAATLADEMDHHPTIVLEYAGMTLRIHTHDQNAITLVDLVYAARLERWLRSNGWAG